MACYKAQDHNGLLLTVVLSEQSSPAASAEPTILMPLMLHGGQHLPNK